MQIKLMYFYKKNKIKILLVVLALLFFLFLVLIYRLLFYEKENEEIILVKEEITEVLKEDANIQDKYYVDIKGEVNKPGVYLLEKEKRVIDVIEASGGLTEQADTSVNNLSRKISDEMVIIIYSKKQVEDFSKTKEEEDLLLEEIKNVESQNNNAVLRQEEIEPSNNREQQKEEPGALQDEKISINTATKEELMTLSGIGSIKADEIIKYREKNGKFTKLEELLNVNGIGEIIFNQIKDTIKL